MYCLRLRLLIAGVVVPLAVLLNMRTSSLGIAVAQRRPTPTWSGAHLSAIQKQIVLRTVDGKPVPYITVQLTPADVALGGPATGAQAKSAVSNAQGEATFTGLCHWVWMASFHGTFEGKVIQPAVDQGRAPYGRTRAGGGFPIVVQRQEEDAAATPVVLQGIPQPEIQPSLFVLVSVQNQWVPALDLALPGEHSQPLAGVALSQPVRTALPTEIQATANSPSQSGNLESFVRWFYVLPLVVALLALYKAWQERREHVGGRSRQSSGSSAPRHIRSLEER